MHSEISLLHVDDEPSLRDLTKTFLERNDEQFTVETATSADEGLEMLGDRPPDCIVSDYNMPGMDGIEFLQTVRADHPDLPFILLTGRGSEEVASDAIAAGVTDYLQKGTGTEQYELLANRIRNAVKQHRSEERLRQTQREYAAVFENAQNGLLLVDVEDDGFRYQQCNPRAVELIGRDKTEIVGKSPHEALGPENGEKVVEAYRTCTEQGTPVEYTVTLDLPMGQVVRECEATPVAANGEVGQLVVAFQDITERRERQQELRRNKRAMDEAPVGITISDPSQDDNPLIYVNDRFEEVTGYDTDETVGRNCRFLQGDDTRAEPVTQMREAIDAQDPVTVELRNYRKDGTEFWNRVSIAPVYDDHGSVVNFVGFQQDITEQKQSERGPRQERDLVTGIVETSPVGIAVVTADGDLSFVNERSETIAGWPYEAVEDTSFNHSRYDIVDESGDSLDTGDTPFGRVLSQETLIHDQVVGMCRPSGERVWLSVNGAPQYNDDGELERAVFAFEDITEQRELEAEFKEMLSRVSDAFFALDDEFRFTHVNGRAEELLQASEDELLGETLWEMYPEAAELGKIWDAFHVAMDTQTPQSLELYYEPLDFWVEATIYPSESGVSVYFRDVTESKERKQELKRVRNRMEFALEFTDAIVWDYNVDEDRATFYPHEEDLYGATVETVDDFIQLIHPDDRQEVSNSIEHSAATGEPIHNEFRIVRNGEIRWMDGPGQVVQDDDDTTRMTGVVRDITERKEYESRLETQNERLEEFISVVSHDLRNPLQVADVRLELLREECESNHIDDIAQALDRMDTLIEDLLTLAREGDQVGELEPVVLADLIGASWQNIAAPEAEIVTDCDRRVRADRTRLQQLLENLLRNAVEHGGADVTITIGKVETGFYIEDDGPGIPEEHRDDVFEAGYSTSSEGTGFGLRIVKQVADAHGWETIVTESEQGGTRFEITGVETPA